jgi:RNA polymerase sigma-70 factor (ECF subfamily)
MHWFWVAVATASLGRLRAAGTTEGDATEDAAIVARAAAGDAGAVAALYDRHGRAVYSLALRVLGDQGEAEDVAQEVFAQAWRQADRYDPRRGQPVAWLLNMARSRAIDRLRRRRAQPSADTEATSEPVDRSPGAEALAITREQVRALREALAGLPVLQRTAIELAYYEGLSQQEIAARLEQPLGTVKTRVRLGLMKLRDALSGSQA